MAQAQTNSHRVTYTQAVMNKSDFSSRQHQSVCMLEFSLQLKYARHFVDAIQSVAFHSCLGCSSGWLSQRDHTCLNERSAQETETNGNDNSGSQEILSKLRANFDKVIDGTDDKKLLSDWEVEKTF